MFYRVKKQQINVIVVNSPGAVSYKTTNNANQKSKCQFEKQDKIRFVFNSQFV